MGFERFANGFIEQLRKEGSADPKGWLSLSEIYDCYSRFFYVNREMLRPSKLDYLYNLSTMNNQPIFETKEFTAKQRRKVFGKGQELYYKRLLQWRFGLKRGLIVYFIGRVLWLRQLMLRIVHTRIGHWIFCKLSHQYEYEE